MLRKLYNNSQLNDIHVLQIISLKPEHRNIQFKTRNEIERREIRKLQNVRT